MCSVLFADKKDDLLGYGRPDDATRGSGIGKLKLVGEGGGGGDDWHSLRCKILINYLKVAARRTRCAFYVVVTRPSI